MPHDNYAMSLDNNERKPIFSPIPIAHFNTLQKNGARSQHKGNKILPVKMKEKKNKN